jgi:predicted transcriptional regulator
MLSKKERYDRRRQWIANFAKRQRVARQWISLPEIADWCARSVTGASVDAEEQARTLAYQRLDQSSRDGEFERAGRRGGRVTTLSEIRYLDPELLRCRLEREQLAHIEGSIRCLAEYCWLPRELVRQWLAARGYSWPAHFDPVAATVSAAGAADIVREPASAAEATPNRVNRAGQSWKPPLRPP